MMPFDAFLIRFSVEFSIMGYLYGNNWIVSAIISARFLLDKFCSSSVISYMCICRYSRSVESVPTQKLKLESY